MSENVPVENDYLNKQVVTSIKSITRSLISQMIYLIKHEYKVQQKSKYTG